MNEVDIIDKVLGILTKNENVSQRYAAEIESLKERKRRSKENKYRLGVIGVTSSGKSTMINALLGEELLPVAAKPSSSQLVSCCKNKQRFAKLYFEDGKIKTLDKKDLNPSIIKEYADEQFNPNNKKGVRQIEIFSPEFELPEDIILVDSPGLDAYGYDNHEHLTMDSLLPTVDFCMFVTTCKTNSDDKMKQVLNQVAEYQKPIVIVQNMIDSIVPKEDGSKTKAQIALEHKNRIERIITESSIKDKSSVAVVQISARYALDARKSKVNSEQDKLSQSNYRLLVDTIIHVFNKIKPRVEQNRLAYLKKEIDRIKDEAYKDGKNSELSIGDFEFDGCIEKLSSSKDDFIKQFSTKLSKLKERLESTRYRSYIDQNYIDSIIKECDNIETYFLQQTKSFRNIITSLCERLYIPPRDIFVISSFEQIQTPSIKTKTIPEHWIDKPQSFLGRVVRPVVRWIFDEHYGQERVPKTVEIDIEATKADIIRYLKNAIYIFEQSRDKWHKSIDGIKDQLQGEINQKKAAYEARKNKALEGQVYLEISEQLFVISSEITIKEEKSSPTNPSNPDVKETVTERIPLSKIDIAYKIFKLSSIIKKNIHYKTISLVTEMNQNNVIIGWDADCESSFASRCFFENIETDKVRLGGNTERRVSIIHNPQSHNNKPLEGNIFLLINAIQIGAAFMQITKSRIIDRIGSKSKVFFVIQDTAEVIHGNALPEVLDELIDHSQKLPFKPIIVFNDENPIYSLAAIQAQTSGCMFHSDEVKIVGSLQKSFPFLISSKNSNHVNIILNKLGKLYGKQ